MTKRLLLIGVLLSASLVHAKDSFVGVSGTTLNDHDSNYLDARGSGLYDEDDWETDGFGNLVNISGNTSGGFSYSNSQTMDGMYSEVGFPPRDAADNPFRRVLIATLPTDNSGTVYYGGQPEEDDGTKYTEWDWFHGGAQINGIYNAVDLSPYNLLLTDSHVVRLTLDYVSATELTVTLTINGTEIDVLYVEDGLGAVDNHEDENVEDGAVEFFASDSGRLPGFLYYDLDSSSDPDPILSHFDDGQSFTSNSDLPVAIPFTGAHAYYCIENRSQYLSLVGTSDYLTYTNHDEADDPAITWSTRYTQGIADYLGSPTNVGAVAIDSYEFTTIPANGTIYQIGNITNSFSQTENEITSGETITYPDGLLYVPDTDYEGTDSFTYKVTDINGTSAAATVEIVVEASDEWTPPFGIPNPGFGIDEEPPADPANWPSAEAVGFYYIDADHPSATDTDNDYGYPDQPRVTIPTSGFSVTPSGGDGKMVLKAHNSAYELRNLSWHRWDLLGSEGNHFWIVGANNSPDKPIITSNSSQSAEEFRINGDYYRFDGIIFDDAGIIRRTDVGNGHDYSVFRHCEFRNWRRNSNGGTVIGGGDSTASNVLVFGCYIHNNGRVLTDLSEERDNHGAGPGSATNYWYLDSLSHHNAGDTFQQTNNNTTEYVYVGRVKGHSDGENHTDVKDLDKFVLSQCDGWDYRTVTYGNSSGNAQILYVNDEGTQQNYAYFLHNRAWDTNGMGIGSASVGATHYMIGNVVFSCPSGTGFGLGAGTGDRHWYLNTIVGCDIGMNNYTAGNPERYVAGNYFIGSITRHWGTVSNYSDMDGFDYNAYDVGGSNMFAWGSATTPTTGTHAAWNSVTGFGANDVGVVGDDLVDSAAYNFALAAGADVIDALPASVAATVFPGLDDMETDLSVTLADMFGITLPQNTDYDIGASEYDAGGSPPTAPSGLSAVAAGSTQINLTWTDNSGDETGFRVERSNTSGTGFTQIAELGAGVTSLNDTGRTPSTEYFYRVRAYNGNGNSAYTSEDSATTNAASGGTMTATSATVTNLTQQ